MEIRDNGLVNNNGEKIMIPAINEHQIKTCFSFARLTSRFQVVCIIAAASSNPKAVSGIELELLCFPYTMLLGYVLCQYLLFILPSRGQLQHRSRQRQNQGEKEQSQANCKFSKALVPQARSEHWQSKDHARKASPHPELVYLAHIC